MDYFSGCETNCDTHITKKNNFFNKTFGYIQPLYISMYVGVGTFTLFSFSIVGSEAKTLNGKETVVNFKDCCFLVFS